MLKSSKRVYLFFGFALCAFGLFGTESQTGNWTELKKMFAEGGEFKLEQDYIAGDDDTCLEIQENKTVTLDLNGHTIDRGLANKANKEDGLVIKMTSGTLIINDSSSEQNGKITGGNCR